MTHACRCRTTSVRRCVPEHRPGRADAVRGLDHAAPAGPSRAARAGSPAGRHRGYGRAPRAWPGEVHGATGQGCPVRRGLRGARDSVPERCPSLVADELGGREPQLHRVCDPHRGRAARRVLPPAEVRSIWKRLRLMGKVTYLRAPVGVMLSIPDGDTEIVKKRAEGVSLTGDPVELLLYVSGPVSYTHLTLPTIYSV